MPITRVGGTGLPSASVVAGRYFATPTTPQVPTPPEHSTAPLPVSSPFGDAASIFRSAWRLQAPPSVAQYDESFSSPVFGSYAAFEPVAQ